MTLLDLMRDGILTAAELLALLFVSPAAAGEPARSDAGLERPVQWHRLSTRLDARLLGSLVDVRFVQTVREDELTAARVDAGSDTPCAGHVRLTEDERIADAFLRAPGAATTIAAAPARRDDTGPDHRIALSIPVGRELPSAMLFNEDDGAYVLLVPHRAAARAELVLRFAAGPAQRRDLGAVDARHAILVPLSSRAELDCLAAGAIELELEDGSVRWWSTLVPERAEARPALQASRPD